MNDTLKRHLISAGVTFASAFLMFVGMQLASPSIEFTKTFALSLLAAGVRAGVKAVFESLKK